MMEASKCCRVADFFGRCLKPEHVVQLIGRVPVALERGAARDILAVVLLTRLSECSVCEIVVNAIDLKSNLERLTGRENDPEGGSLVVVLEALKVSLGLGY